MKLSVLVLTFNHEEYIEDAIYSAINQDTNFQYEIVIGDDFSDDNTRKILLKIKNKHPDKIKLIFHEKNIGFRENGDITYKNCNGQYIALLDGDDYWIDNKKLQTQVEYLDKNPSICSCFHQVIKKTENNNTEQLFPDFIKKNTYNTLDVLNNFFIPTLSIVFRRSAINQFPIEYFKMPNPDWLINIICAENGGIGYIKKVMGVYRIHNRGIWSNQSKIEAYEKTIYGAKLINKYTKYKYNRILKKRIRSWRIRICYWNLRSKKIIEFIINLYKFIIGK